MNEKVDIEISRILASTKKKVPVYKNDRAVFVVDIPAVVKILQERFNITKK